MTTLDSQVDHEPQPEDPENLILPARAGEDTEEERFVRMYYIKHSASDWKGHEKHAPRDDEVMGDRYDLCSNTDLVTRLRNALRRFRSVEITAQKNNAEVKVKKNSDADKIDVDEASDDNEFSEEE